MALRARVVLLWQEEEDSSSSLKREGGLGCKGCACLVSSDWHLPWTESSLVAIPSAVKPAERGRRTACGKGPGGTQAGGDGQ